MRPLRTEGPWRFRELTPQDAAAISGWRYGGLYAFCDTEADPEFAGRQWAVTRLRLEVASFNRRALAVYMRLGFASVGRFSRAAPELGGRAVEWVGMEAAAVGPECAKSESREDDHD